MAEYENALGVNAQVRYVGRVGTHAVGETWQTGLRIGWSDTAGPFGFSEGRVTLAKHTVKDAFVNRSITNMNVAQGWAGVGVENVPTDANQDAIATALRQWCVTIRNNLSNQYVLGDIRLYPFLEDGTSATAPSIYTPTGVGTDPQVATAMPLDTAYALALGSAVRGPSGRGRMFLGGLGTTWLEANGTPKVTVQDSVRSATAVLLQSLRFGGGASLAWTPVLHTRGTDTGSVIRNVRTNTLFETQRRRDRQIEPVWLETAVP